MTASFDWSPFKESAAENESETSPDQSFDWTSFKEESPEKKSKFPDTFEEFLKSKPPESRHIGADIVNTGTAFAGLPGDIASIFIGDNPVTSENLRGKVFESIPSLAPKNEQEKEWDEGLSTVMGLVAPTGPLKAGAKLVGKGIGKLGGNAITKALKGKYQELYQLGKSMGIDEKALAPFRHGKVTEWTLKNLAKLGETAKRGIDFAEKLATPFYQTLDKAGEALPLNKIVSRSLVRNFSDIVNDIKKSPALVNESKDVIKFLEEAAYNIKSNPNYTVEGLMSLYKQMNKAVNWTSIKQTGKGHLVSQAKDAVMKGIYGMSPKIGRDFDGINKLYSGYKTLAKEVTPGKLIDYANKGGPLGYALLSLMTGHDFGESLAKGLSLHFGKKAIGKISGKLLTDPKWVGLKEKAINLVKKGSVTGLPKIIQAIKKKADMSHIDLNEED